MSQTRPSIEPQSQRRVSLVKGAVTMTATPKYDDLDGVRAALAEKNVKAVSALVSSAATGYLTWSKAGNDRTIAACVATWSAVEIGMIPPARGAKTADGTPKVNKAASEDRAAYAKRFGVSATDVTRWARCGRAVVECGVDPKSELFTNLSSKSWATDKAIGAALDKDGVTNGDLIRAVAASRDSEGKRIGTNTAGANPNDGTDVSADLTNLGKCKVALELVTSLLPSLDGDSWTVIRNIMHNIEAGEVHRRSEATKAAALAESAAKGTPKAPTAPTPADMPKAGKAA